MSTTENFAIQTRSKNRESPEKIQEITFLKPTFDQLKPVMRRRSVSFNMPEYRECKSLDSSPDSPMRLRSHTSEAGSPTLEQALMMGRDSPGSDDAGYGSFQSDGLRRDDDNESPNSQPPDRSYSPGEPRPTLEATLAEADQAVAQAANKLLKLKEVQAAIYEEMNRNNTPNDSTFLSALLSSTQGHKNMDSQIFEQRDLLGESYLDKDTISAFDQQRQFDKNRDPLALERAARQYRNAASVSEAKGTWQGQLIPKKQAGRHSSFSSKIFLGGVPWDITEESLMQAFMEFGPVRVEWPGKDNNPTPKGYLYIVFEDEDRIKELLSQCAQDFSNGGSYYYKIASQKRGMKEIQIIPWLVEDSTYIGYPSPQLDPKKTVFVGALHGMMNAQSLALIFNDLFGNVVFAGLDTDKYKYPIGSGRVTFSSDKSFRKAVKTAFIEIKTARFQKKIQVDPYLEDALCSVCNMKQGPYFCREEECFNYFCRGCWDRVHVSMPHHKPLMRNIRGLTRARLQDFFPSDCYSTSQMPPITTPSFSNLRDTKLMMDPWAHVDQDKRYDQLDTWSRARRGEQRHQDNWRMSAGGAAAVAPAGHHTWKSPNKEPSWMTSDFTWGDDQSKLSAVFENTLNLGLNERTASLKPFFDEDQFATPNKHSQQFDGSRSLYQPVRPIFNEKGFSGMGGVAGQFDRGCRETAASTFGHSGGFDRFGLRSAGLGDTSEFMFKSIIGSGGILSDDSKCSDSHN